MDYKKSDYNFFERRADNETIVFNTVTGAIGIFDDDTLCRFRHDDLSDEETGLLLEKGVLVPIDEDERKKIDNDRVKSAVSTLKKYYRVWTTSACNANCEYCFEKEIAPENMTIGTAKSLVSFIGSNLAPGDVLEIEWFGGEPLANAPIIDYLSKELIALCKDRSCKYKANMISNGSLVTREIAELMSSAWQIYNIQITLDGYGSAYDEIKKYSNPSKYNFYSVIDSIKLIAEKNIHVSIRMNYSGENYEDLTRLISFLKKELANYSRISYYVYPIWSVYQADGTVFASKASANSDFLKLCSLLVENKLRTPTSAVRIEYKTGNCISCNKSSFVVFPNGALGKCCEAHSRIIGDIWNGVTNKEEYEYWVNPSLDEECEKCIFLPICQGGCKASKYTLMPKCYLFKESFDRVIRWYAQHLSNANDNTV